MVKGEQLEIGTRAPNCIPDCPISWGGMDGNLWLCAMTAVRPKLFDFKHPKIVKRN
jgi:hypothetical protein